MKKSNKHEEEQLIYKLQKKVLLFIAVYFLASTSAFAVLIVNPARPITHSVIVQPIVVSDDDGSNTANFFSHPEQKSVIEGLVDDIWAQAGINVDFLAANQWSNSFANNGNILPRPNSDIGLMLSDGFSAGVTSANPNVINMFFVKVSAGFSQLGPNHVAGYALIGEDGTTLYIGDNLLSFAAGQEAIATVIAHELGHNLGLVHTNSLDYPEENLNLMWSGTDGPGLRTGHLLNSAQVTTALASNFSVATVPVPAAVWLFGSAILMMFGIQRHRNL